MSVEREPGGGAFSSVAEVWDGGWKALRAVVVSGCLLRSLLKPILCVTAGGSGDCRRPVEEKERKSMKLLETIFSLGTTLTLTRLSRLLLRSIPQLDPFFPFYFHSPSSAAPRFLLSHAGVFSPFPSISSLDSSASLNARLIYIEHRPIWIQKSVAELECAAYEGAEYHE